MIIPVFTVPDDHPFVYRIIWQANVTAYRIIAHTAQGEGEGRK